MLLTSLHAFIKEEVEAVVLETHHGGEYDATNFIEHPVATVITPLGMDHIQQLGPTIENIAWHKSGIFKPGAHAFSHPQEDGPAQVLRDRAAEKDVRLDFVTDNPSLPAEALSLKPAVQRTNCSVALAAVRGFLERESRHEAGPITSVDVQQAVEQFVWPGRFQLVVEGACRWFLDGAHNEMSVTKAGEWFLESIKSEDPKTSTRILIFSQVSEHRDPELVLKHLAESLKTADLDFVIFTTYDPYQSFQEASGMIYQPSRFLQIANACLSLCP